MKRDTEDTPEPSRPQDNEIEEIGQVEAGFLDRLNDWLSRENSEGLNPVMYVYKMDATGARQLCGKYEGSEIPDEHIIGLTFGSGKYRAHVHIPAGKNQSRANRAWQFSIHQQYDELRRQAAFAPGTVPFFPSRFGPGNSSPAPVLQAPTGIADSLGLVKEIIALLAPLMIAGKGNGNADGLNMGAILMQNYQTLDTVLKKNLLDTHSMMRRRLEDLSMDGQDDTPDEEADGCPAWLKPFLPVIEKALPALLGSGPKAQAAATVVKTLPEFKRAMSNKSDFTRVIEYFDRTIGPEKVDRLLKNLKAERPK